MVTRKIVEIIMLIVFLPVVSLNEYLEISIR